MGHHDVLGYELNIGSSWLDWKCAYTKLFPILFSFAGRNYEFI